MATKQHPGVTVQQAAARDHGWRLADVKVGELKDLKRGGCAFFRASDPTRLDQAPADYAVLPSGQVAQDVGQVLRKCGQGAPAEWWAQVIARLGGVRGILVDQHAPSALRKLRAAGAEWAPPALKATRAGTALRFFTTDYESGAVFQVQATLPSLGPLVVEQEQVVPR